MPGPESVVGDPIARPPWPPPRPARARPVGQAAGREGPRVRTVTVTVQVTMTGEDALSEAVELAERLRPLAATVVAAPAAAPAAPAEPPGWPPLRIHPSRFVAELNGEPLPLTRREYGLLLFLADHPGRVYTRPQLLRAVWEDLVSGVRTVDVHVRRIRAKLGDAGPVIGTVHGVGYRLDRADRVAVIRGTG